MAPVPVGATRRALVVAAGATVLGLLPSPRATALRGWCRTDPLISIDGELADIFVAVDAPIEMLAAASGPIAYVVTLPRGVRGRLIAKGVGFGHGERLEFRSSRRRKGRADRIDVHVSVRVPAAKDLPLWLEFAPRVVGILAPERKKGRTNKRVALKTRF